jgi:hypothetical protein
MRRRRRTDSRCVGGNVAGADPHRKTLSVTVLDERGGVLGTKHSRCPELVTGRCGSGCSRSGPLCRFGIENATGIVSMPGSRRRSWSAPPTRPGSATLARTNPSTRARIALAVASSVSVLSSSNLVRGAAMPSAPTRYASCQERVCTVIRRASNPPDVAAVITATGLRYSSPVPTSQSSALTNPIAPPAPSSGTTTGSSPPAVATHWHATRMSRSRTDCRSPHRRFRPLRPGRAPRRDRSTPIPKRPAHPRTRPPVSNTSAPMRRVDRLAP